MTYFHPRDFDTGQPMIPGLSRVRQFKSYIGIAKTYRKLDAVIKSEQFSPLLQAFDGRRVLDSVRL